MKPQCNSAADCLRELARVMRQFGIKYIRDAIVSDYVKYIGVQARVDELSRFSKPIHWSFAIAEVEGKPVFIGNELYYEGEKLSMTRYYDGLLQGRDASNMLRTGKAEHLSWNPPKPKTVMVELTVDDASNFAEAYETLTCGGVHKNMAQACKKALEELK